MIAYSAQSLDAEGLAEGARGGSEGPKAFVPQAAPMTSDRPVSRISVASW